MRASPMFMKIAEDASRHGTRLSFEEFDESFSAARGAAEEYDDGRPLWTRLLGRLKTFKPSKRYCRLPKGSLMAGSIDFQPGGTGVLIRHGLAPYLRGLNPDFYLDLGGADEGGGLMMSRPGHAHHIVPMNWTPRTVTIGSQTRPIVILRGASDAGEKLTMAIVMEIADFFETKPAPEPVRGRRF